MKWAILLTGDSADLKTLGESYNEPDLSVSDESGQFVLRSTQFDSLETAGAVRDKARELATAVSGVARLQLGALQPVEVGAVVQFREDGTENTFISPPPATLQLRGLLTSLIVRRADGTVETHYPADHGPDWVKAALQYEVVARALRLRDAGCLEWVDLYRLYEVIESDVPLNEMKAKGWVTGREIERFKRTANSQRAIGDKARYGKDPYEPPKDPLLLGKARALVDSILKYWLEEKAGSAR